MAQALLAGSLSAREPAALVRSAGFLADGHPAHPNAVQAVAELGRDISRHRSRLLRPADVLGADLILTMTREHRRRIVEATPAVRLRTFTLKEFVRRGHDAGPRPGPVPLDDWLAALARRPARAPRMVDTPGDRSSDAADASEASEASDDVVDPLGQPLDAFRATAHDLRVWCDRAARLLAG
jgi:protein-tyrosine phosphatase